MFAVALAYGSAATAGQKKDKDKKEETPDISTIMQKGHGKGGCLATIGAAVKGGEWEKAQKSATVLAGFGEALGKNKPPKGDEKSWKALTEKYAENTKAVATAAEAKDSDKTQAALKAIQQSCKGCHSVHK